MIIPARGYPKQPIPHRFAGILLVGNNGVDVMKTCSKCKKEKPLSDFFRNKTRSGYFIRCKSCCGKDQISYRKTLAGKLSQTKYDTSEKGKRSRKRYDQSAKGKIARDRQMKKYSLANPAKRDAKRLVYNAVRRGDLIRQPCAVCSTTENIHAHHCDYDKPLDVMWLCQKHHSDWHKNHGEII